MRFNSYLEHYIDYTKDEIDENQRTKLIEIYNTTMYNCDKLTDFTLYSFIMAWLLDAYQERTCTIGPNFSMALAYHTNTADKIVNIIDIHETWFEEAAIRDYILKLNNKLTYQIQKLKQMNLEIIYT